MAITDVIVQYRRFIKRRNYSPHTIRNYMHTLRQFILWVDVPIEQVTHQILLSYIDHLLDRRLTPKTINCHLDSIRGFYNYLIHEERVAMFIQSSVGIHYDCPVRCPDTSETRMLSVYLRCINKVTGIGPCSC